MHSCCAYIPPTHSRTCKVSFKVGTAQHTKTHVVHVVDTTGAMLMKKQAQPCPDSNLRNLGMVITTPGKQTPPTSGNTQQLQERQSDVRKATTHNHKGWLHQRTCTRAQTRPTARMTQHQQCSVITKTLWQPSHHVGRKSSCAAARKARLKVGCVCPGLTPDEDVSWFTLSCAAAGVVSPAAALAHVGPAAGLALKALDLQLC